jgi:hypothetical protein
MCGGGYAPPKCRHFFLGYALKFRGAAPNIYTDRTVGQSRHRTSNGEAGNNKLTWLFLLNLFERSRAAFANVRITSRLSYPS